LARLVNQNGAVGQWRTLGIGLVFESRGVGQGEPRLAAPCISTLDIKIEVSRHSTSERKTEKMREIQEAVLEELEIDELEEVIAPGATFSD